MHCYDVKFTQEGMEIYIAKSKTITDQYRQGNTVPIARTNMPRHDAREILHHRGDGNIFKTVPVQTDNYNKIEAEDTRSWFIELHQDQGAGVG